MMKNLFILMVLIFTTVLPVSATTVSGGISTQEMRGNRLIDSQTNAPIGNAKVSLPKFNYTTYTDSNGHFELQPIDGTTILSIEKQGYRPFSLTINNTANPLTIGIEKSNATDIIIESEMMHLGDDNYSKASANAGFFKLRSSGPSFSKDFIMKQNTLNSNNYLIIGSIVGIDTLMARSMGQNRIVNSYSSPPEVYFNGTKIAEIQLNGDNQRVKIPNSMIKPEKVNQITIRTGRNLMQTAYIDYDDVEIANLSILSE